MSFVKCLESSHEVSDMCKFFSHLHIQHSQNSFDQFAIILRDLILLQGAKLDIYDTYFKLKIGPDIR